MKVAVVLDTDNGLDSTVSHSFGRAQYFGFIELTEDGQDKIEILPNPHANSSSGAGIQSAQFVINHGAEVVISGDVGPNSYEVLAEGGVKMFSSPSVPLREALELYRKGSLRPISVPARKEGKHHHHR